MKLFFNKIFAGEKYGALNDLPGKRRIIIVREIPIIMDLVHIFLMKDIKSQTVIRQ
jgi:hypothetical protein